MLPTEVHLQRGVQNTISHNPSATFLSFVGRPQQSVAQSRYTYKLALMLAARQRSHPTQTVARNGVSGRDDSKALLSRSVVSAMKICCSKPRPVLPAE